jgi:copper homeostasis protein
VLGVLTRDGAVDLERTRKLVELARPLQVTFHRAFDVCKDLDRALEDVIATGADRLLTSGGKADALKGVAGIARLRKRAGDRIGIMAGGAIRASNVRNLAIRTGIREVHTSLGANVKSSNGRAKPGTRQDGSKRLLVLERDVRAFKSALESIG